MKHVLPNDPLGEWSEGELGTKVAYNGRETKDLLIYTMAIIKIALIFCDLMPKLIWVLSGNRP